MPGNDYHFITHWRLEGIVEEVAEVIGNAPELVRWWPSVSRCKRIRRRMGKTATRVEDTSNLALLEGIPLHALQAL